MPKPNIKNNMRSLNKGVTFVDKIPSTLQIHICLL